MGPGLTASCSVEIRKLQRIVRGSQSNLFSLTAAILGAKCIKMYYPNIAGNCNHNVDVYPFLHLAFGIQPAFEEKSTCFGLVTVQRVCVVPCL